MIAPDLQPLAHPIANLKPLPGNPRRGNVEAVMRSYAQFGQRKPVVALRDGTVIAGNHQLQAATMLGWDELAVVFVDDDDTTAKAYALADNRTADLGTYDAPDLAEMLQAVALDPELLLATGYNTAEVEALLGQLDEITPTDFPELPTDDRDPFQRMTFTLHDEEVEIVERALSIANGTTLEQLASFTAWLRTQNVTANQINEATQSFMGGHYLSSGSQPAIPTPTAWSQMKHLVSDVPEWVTELIERKERIKMSDNENERGSALARICKEWLETNDNG